MPTGTAGWEIWFRRRVGLPKQSDLSPACSASASVTLNGPTWLPVMGIDAFSGPDSNVTADGTGVREYVYNGAATTITLDITLHGVAGAPDPQDAYLKHGKF